MLCFVVGLATIWLPLPTGFVFMVVGLALLLVSSPQVASWLTWLRRRFPALDRRLRRVEPHLPVRLRWALAQTRA